MIFHQVVCPQPALLGGFQVSGGGTATKMQIKYKCCPIADSHGTCFWKGAKEAQEATMGADFSGSLEDAIDSDGGLMNMLKLKVECPVWDGKVTAISSWAFRNSNPKTDCGADNA